MYIENEKKRLQQLLRAIQAVVSGDFTKTIKVAKIDDDLLPIETGFNLLVKDLDHLLKENKEKIQELNLTIKQRDDVQERLEEKIEELEKTLKAIVGRELKMSQLKEEVQTLKEKLEKYEKGR